MIFIIDDDEIMADCIKRAIDYPVRTFSNAIDAMQVISDGEIPELIFLDVLLDGPNGFTFLHELMSYPDTAKIPIVIVTLLDLDFNSLDNYGVVGVLKKDCFTPQDIKNYVHQFIS